MLLNEKNENLLLYQQVSSVCRSTDKEQTDYHANENFKSLETASKIYYVHRQEIDIAVDK